jgi:LacI family transcriptional regulator
MMHCERGTIRMTKAQTKATSKPSRPQSSSMTNGKTVVAIYDLGIGYDRMLIAVQKPDAPPGITVLNYYGPKEGFWDWQKSIHLDGVVGRFLTQADVAPFLQAGLKVVTWVPPNEPLGIPVVASDDVAIGAMVARYFMERGFQQFAFVDVPASWSHKRHEGFRQTLKTAGHTCISMEFDPWVKDAEALAKSRQHLKQSLAELPKGTAVMAANDSTAIILVQQANFAKRVVPSDLAVIGVDDDQVICQFSGPITISSVVQDYNQICGKAFDLMWKILDGEAPSSEPVLVPPLLVRTRQSSDITTSHDQHLAKAMAFIHAHAHEPVAIGDIARAAGVSEQLLRRKFQVTYNRSPHDELVRRRVALAQGLLLQGEENINRIAELSGFGSVQRYYIAFRRIAQMSPKEYKAKFKHILGR